MAEYFHNASKIAGLIHSLDQPLNYKGTLYILDTVWFTRNKMLEKSNSHGSILLSVSLLFKDEETTGYKKVDSFMFVISFESLLNRGTEKSEFIKNIHRIKTFRDSMKRFKSSSPEVLKDREQQKEFYLDYVEELRNSDSTEYGFTSR